MDLGIKDKRVLITGASQGIGKEIALAFAKEKCHVSIIARRKSELENVVEEMGGEREGHDYLAIDLMEKGAGKYAVQELAKKNGEYEIVVHNIGGTLGVKNALAPVEDWQRVWYFNAGIAIDINEVVVPPMKEKKWGRIIHISSISGESLRGSAPYATAKAYLNAYAKSLGRVVAQDGIVVSALMPGAIYAAGGHWDENSEINCKDKEAFFKKKNDFLRHHHAVGRLGNAEEIAPFALFMASQYVSFAQGSTIPIDGGTM